MTLKLMDALKGEFGVIVDTAKMAGIPLFAKRDVPTCINVDIDDLKRKHQGFDGAALRMTKRRNDMGIADRSVEINQQIKRLNSSGNYAPVAVFVYLLKYSFLFKEAEASENHQKLNQDLLLGLEIKSAPQYSRFRRKCDRVRRLCDVLGVAGGCAMGTCVKIYSIENMVNTEFKDLIKELKMNRRLISFSQTLSVDDTGMPMIRQLTATVTTASISSSSTSS